MLICDLRPLKEKIKSSGCSVDLIDFMFYNSFKLYLN